VPVGAGRISLHMQIVVILGVWRSGTSCVAGMVSKLGGQFGVSFHPPANPNPKGFFEEQSLHRMCVASFGEPLLFQIRDTDSIRRDLVSWVHSMRESYPSASLLGAKHPALCAIVKYVVDCWGPRIRLIAVDRDLRSVHTSLRRYPWWSSVRPDEITSRVLGCRDRQLLQYLHLRVSYDTVIHDPFREAWRIAKFLDVWDPEKIQAAADFVDPALNRCASYIAGSGNLHPAGVRGTAYSINHFPKTGSNGTPQEPATPCG